MYNQEIVSAICDNHLYEYFIVSYDFKILKYSKDISLYCDMPQEGQNLFALLPEFVGLEEDIQEIIENKKESLLLPEVFKAPSSYVNIHIHTGRESRTLIVLFENITELTDAQQHTKQVLNENLLLLEELEEKNHQLKRFNQEMQTLVEVEVAKNLEKQYVLELQTRHAQMGEMIAMITHQWKQPLSVIQTVCTNLKMKYELKTLSQPFFSTKIENILKQVSFMNHTVSDFQDFFTPSKEKVLFNVKENISSVLHLVEAEYALENIVIDIVGDGTVCILGYANEYNQVILSLLQNAKDALLSHAPKTMRIVIDLQKEDKSILVSISDNAGGIDENIIEDIFTQYMTTKEKGSGLGLHIAKSVIENNMQGKLWVENTLEGATFFIRV